MPAHKEIEVDRISYPLVHVPGGPFRMGTVPTEFRKTDDEEPQREVILDAYYIGKYFVTGAQYTQFTKETKHHQFHFHRDPRFNAPDCPVVGVNWHDVQKFLTWLNKKTGESFRLPTEAEWEKAARGNDGREYPWGNEWDSAKANTSESRLKRLTPVNNYPQGRSPYGCFDMAGNAYDWCNDWFHPETYRHSPRTNPQGAITGRRKTVRGGSWVARGQFASRCSNRAAYEPIQAPHNVSFRIATSANCVEKNLNPQI